MHLLFSYQFYLSELILIAVVKILTLKFVSVIREMFIKNLYAKVFSWYNGKGCWERSNIESSYVSVRRHEVW